MSTQHLSPLRNILLALLLASLNACGDDDGRAPNFDGGGGITDFGLADLGFDGPPPDLAGCPDSDGDGVPSATCGGSDCDDADPTRYPGATEVCDGNDEDCDEATRGPDADGDGFEYAACCNGPSNCGGDCDDARATVNPTATESCNLVDDDCDGSVDEDATITACFDADGDGRGTLTDTFVGCAPPPGSVSVCNDCDDTSSTRFVGAPELCNGVDDDCDGAIDEECSCMTGSMRVCGREVGACATGMQRCIGGTWETGCTGGVFPAVELCNDVDDDCDGITDEGVSYTFYPDCDRDGFGNSALERTSCARPTGVPPACPDGFWTTTGGDCDDTDPMRSSGTEGCMSRDGGSDDDGGSDAGVFDGGSDAGAMDAGLPDAGRSDGGACVPRPLAPPVPGACVMRAADGGRTRECDDCVLAAAYQCSRANSFLLGACAAAVDAYDCCTQSCTGSPTCCVSEAAAVAMRCETSELAVFCSADVAVCNTVPTDAGPMDAGMADAGLADAGPMDAGPRDAGSDGPLDEACTCPTGTSCSLGLGQGFCIRNRRVADAVCTEFPLPIPVCGLFCISPTESYACTGTSEICCPSGTLSIAGNPVVECDSATPCSGGRSCTGGVCGTLSM